MSFFTNLTDRFAGFLFLLLVIGGVNYGLMGIADYDLLGEIFASGTVMKVVYVLIGLAALLSLDKAFEMFQPHSRKAS